MPLPILYIFSGLPGSGKSTLAQRVAGEFGCAYVRIDTVEQALRDLCRISVEAEGYEMAYRLAADSLKIGVIVGEELSHENSKRVRILAVFSAGSIGAVEHSRVHRVHYPHDMGAGHAGAGVAGSFWRIVGDCTRGGRIAFPGEMAALSKRDFLDDRDG